MTLEYQEIGAEQLEVVRPLWEKLRAYHVALTPQFAARRSREPEPADLLRDKSHVTGGWLRSLTYVRVRPRK
jgi:hypothetical protein